MFGKNAWVTFAVDETMAIEAIVLAKSLSRVVTKADTIVFAPFDIPETVRKTLARYFDVVKLENIPTKQCFGKSDILKLAAWNLGMYSKCVVLDSKTLVMINSDELFNSEEKICAVKTTGCNCSSGHFDSSVLVIQPCIETYVRLSRLAMKNGRNFNFEKSLNAFYKSSNVEKGTLPSTYNSRVSRTNENSDGAKIFSFQNDEPLINYAMGNNNNKIDERSLTIFKTWKLLYNEIEGKITDKCPRQSTHLNGPSKNETYSNKNRYYKDGIAIVGHSCRFPGANNSNEFWDLLSTGGDAICQIPPKRLLEWQRHDPRFTESKAGFLKCPIDEFDAGFFGISPKEAAYIDPQQRLLLEVTWEALEDAAISPDSIKGGSTGVFSGVWTHDYERLISDHISGSDVGRSVLGNAFSATASRISHFLGINGPNIATESGCSSSMVALHLACDSLRRGETDLGLVLGANILILQFPLSEIPILAADGHCKTYDEKADGFGRAEGIAVVLLKRLPDAIQNGDKILGIIRGSALSNEGTTSSFGTPSKLCQEIAIKEALRNSGVEPKDVDYVEAHGTGTPVGDPIEFAAISAGYGHCTRDKPLVVGSVKTNIGHTESTAGLAGLIKVFLAMKHEIIPVHRNFTTLNPNINLDTLPAIIPTEPQTWCQNSERVRIAGISSFGISGTNVHVILEEPPTDIYYKNQPNESITERSHFILSLSAKSKSALKRLAAEYMKHLSLNPTANIANVTFTANNGRAQLKYRLFVTAKNVEELKSNLNQLEYLPPKIVPGQEKIALIFTDHQDAKYFDIAKCFYNSNLIFRSAFNDCDRFLTKTFKISLSHALLQQETHLSSSELPLCVFAVQYSLLRLWISLGVEPEMVLGFGVGEFVAATAAGILNFESALLMLVHQFVFKDNCLPISLATGFQKITSKYCTFVSGMTGKCMIKDKVNMDYWERATKGEIEFSKAIETLGKNGVNILVELGLRPLSFFDIDCFPQNVLRLPSIRQGEEQWQTFLNTLGVLFSNSVDIKWECLDKSIPREKVELPFYPFEKKRYWIEAESGSFRKSLHPLLGKKLMLAKTNYTVYENTWNLKELSYLADHQVAHVTVLPGAGFLEILLAASRDCLFEKDNKYASELLKVEDFVVESPLELEENKNYKIQVVATPSESDKLLVCIYMYQKLNGYNDEKGWKRYSSGTVSLAKEMSIDAAEDLENIRLRCPTEKSARDFYKLAPEIGIFFGDTFQSVDTVWEGVEEILAKVTLPSKAGNMKDYIYHPIILDAMIQSFGLTIGKDQADLYLPVGVGNFVMIDSSFEDFCFCHATWKAESTTGTVKLYSKDNRLLAVMTDVRLLRTSISAFLNVINSQKNKLPGMYHEVWRVRDGPVQSRVDLSHLFDPYGQNQNFVKNTDRKIQDMDLFKIADEFTSLAIIEVFLINGFNPVVEKIYNCRGLMQNYLLRTSCNRFFGRLFEILAEDGYFTLLNNEYGISEEWQMVKPFPDLDEILSRQRSLQNKALSKTGSGKKSPIDLIIKCKEVIWKVLQGTVNPTKVLTDIEDADYFSICDDGQSCVVSSANVSTFIASILKELKPGGNMSGSVVRILEIGGGNGKIAKEIIEALQKAPISFRYTFTDISSNALESAKSLLANVSGVEFRVMDVEKEPSTQNYCPFYYDIVLASNVLHSTESLRNSVKNIRKLLKPKGLFLILEMLKPIRHADFILGTISEKMWRFKDYDVRMHPIVPKITWDKILEETDFSSSTLLSHEEEISSLLVTRAEEITSEKSSDNAADDPTWIIIPGSAKINFHLHDKLRACGKAVLQIKRKGQETIAENSENVFYTHSVDYTEYSETLRNLFSNYKIEGIICYYSFDQDTVQDSEYLEMLNLCKYLAVNTTSHLSIYVVIRGVFYISSSNQSNVYPSNSPILGMFKTLINEQAHLDGKIIDLDPDVVDLRSESDEVLFELYESEETIVCYRNRKRLVNRFVVVPKPLAPLTLPQGRYKLEIPKSKKLNDVKFSSAIKDPLGIDDVEVTVKAFALNFRDIFVILKPDMYSTIFEAVGTDFAGIVSRIGTSVRKYKVGDEVFGISQASSAASHVIVNSNTILLKPDSFTFADASTIPTVFLTAYYCLVSVAKLKKGETILIHVASGGVGLIAIQIAKYIGAKIIVTAGSHRKRSYLKSIGLENIFHSRDLTYAEDIDGVTENRGVDVVLNSLTGHGFKEATLRICATGARFVEIGKVNIWQPATVKQLRPDVAYTIVDLEKVNQQEMSQLMTAMQIMFHNKNAETFSPLPYSRYEMPCIRDALNYFLKSQHIGKIVVAAPDLVTSSGGYNFTKEMVFNSNATYLITGGLGGIGLEVAKWISDCGAQNIVLVGRSPPNEMVVSILNTIKAKGCRVVALQADIGDFQQCRALFQNVQLNLNLPPLRGVIHSAATLSDAVFTNQTWTKFQNVFNAKVNGTWNLHQLTKHMHLEHFVMFSSIASVFGPMGQSNYTAGNTFLDSVAHYRHSIGLPAQTINWGAWSEVGAATSTAYGKEGSLGVKPFSPNQGVAALKFVMTHPNFTQLAVIELDITEFKQNFCQRGNILSELVSDENSTVQSTSLQTNTFWEEISNLSVEKTFLNIKRRLEAIIHRTLKLPATEPLDEQQSFSDMGLDSLMAVEMRNKLQNVFGKKLILNANSLFEFSTINALSRHLAELTVSIKLSEKCSNEKVRVDMESVYTLVNKDSILPDDIQGRGEAVCLSQIKSVLLTGVTGRFGPYILRDLLHRKNLKIFCLIKAKNSKYAQKKLLANLKKFNLEHDIDLDRISVVVGNITTDKMGISNQEYNHLAESVDAIFHLAAKANHVEQYRINKLNNIDIRSVNVIGTLNILRFASHLKTKRIIFASTFATINRLTDDGFASEEFPEDDNSGDGISMGYVLTKFAGEKLMKEANKRGIPSTVIRYPTLIGDSQTGHFTIDTDSFLNFVFLSCRLGIAPEMEGSWYCLPVDIASRLTIDLAFSDYSKQNIFNLFQPTGINSKDLVYFGEKLGVKVELVKEKEFSDKLQREVKNISWLSLFADAYESNFMSAVSGSNLMTKLSLKSGKSVYRISDTLQNIIPNILDTIPSIIDIVQVYIDFTKKSDFFGKLGVGDITEQFNET